MSTLPLITATLILVAGVIDDFRSRKVHNWLFGVCTAAAVLASVSSAGLAGLNTAFLGFVAGLAAMLPLVLLHVVGAGDMKLLAAFGAAAGWNAAIDVAILSLIWGALFGVLQVVLKGQLVATLKNMVSIASFKERRTIELHRMPFTAAMLVGWFSHLVHLKVL